MGLGGVSIVGIFVYLVCVDTRISLIIIYVCRYVCFPALMVFLFAG